MRGSSPLPLVAVDGSNRFNGTLPERPPSTSGSGPNVRRDHDALPVPHPIPRDEHGSECDRRIEELKHIYEKLLREKDAQIEGFGRERDLWMELMKERDLRIEDIKREKEARIGEVKREKDERIEELKREKDARIEELRKEKDGRIEEVKRDREVAIKNVEEQLERSRREVLQLREKNNDRTQGAGGSRHTQTLALPGWDPDCKWLKVELTREVRDGT